MIGRKKSGISLEKKLLGSVLVCGLRVAFRYFL